MKYLLLIIATAWCYSGVSAQNSDKEQPQNSRHIERVNARKARNEVYVKHIDSLVLSRNFTFTPLTFQREPAGTQQNIYQLMYMLQVAPHFTDIYLPYIKGIAPPYSLTRLNYALSSESIEGYIAVQGDDQWTITFTSSLFGINTYTFRLQIYAITGEAVLTISSNVYNDVTYNGSIAAR